MERSTGFTLLEVLVALFILAVALAAVMRTVTGAITTAGALRDRTLALWVADDRLAHLETLSKWPGLGVVRTHMREDGRRFVIRTHVRSTPVPGLRRLDITVRRVHGSDPLMRLAGFVRQP